jgi:hypothetical protein
VKNQRLVGEDLKRIECIRVLLEPRKDKFRQELRLGSLQP